MVESGAGHRYVYSETISDPPGRYQAMRRKKRVQWECASAAFAVLPRPARAIRLGFRRQLVRSRVLLPHLVFPMLVRVIARPPRRRARAPGAVPSRMSRPGGTTPRVDFGPAPQSRAVLIETGQVR